MTQSVYLYGILPAPGPTDLELEGLDRKPVQTQSLDGFRILYSEASQPKYLASRRNLLSHERVLEAVMHQGYRTVLPLQFGLVVDDWSGVSEQLTVPYGQALTRLFERIDGQREVSLKLFWDEAAELKALMAERPDLQSQRDALVGTPLSMEAVIAIGQLIEAGMTERRQAIVEIFTNALSDLVHETVENDPLTPDMIYNAAYLIAWESESTFGERVEVLDSRFEDRLRIRYNNFTAPFNFAQLTGLERD